MPRPRKPAATLRLAGAFAKNPDRERAEPVAAGDIGMWCAGSANPCDIWAELARIAPAGLLTSADRPALQAATLLLARMRTIPATITPAMVTALFSALGKLGMTPHGRIQLAAPKVDEPDADQLWRRGEYARALAANPFTEFAFDDHTLTDEERAEAHRLREQWAGAAQRKGRRS